MVNMNRFFEWIYNLIFHTKEKQNKLKRKAALAIYQNNYGMSIKIKRNISDLTEIIENSTTQLNKLLEIENTKYNNYLKKINIE